MSLLSALNIGAAGLAVNQKGIEVTGNNAANVNTVGYSKQSLVISSSPTLEFRGQMIGSGATVSSIARSSNPFVIKQLIGAAANYGMADAKSLPLSEIERIISVGEDSLSSDLDQFFDAWQQLSENPAASLERQQVMQAGENLADTLKTMVNNLYSVQNGINDSLEGQLTTLNQQLQEIADLNVRILSAEAGGISANALRDQRDLLLQKVSETAGINYFENSNGMVSVQLPGGQALVTGANAATLEMDRGTGIITLSTGQSSVELSDNHFGGAIGGLLELRDNMIPELVDQLDQLAYSLATAVNAVHSSGYDASGSAGGDFFTFSTSGPEVWSGAATTLTMALTDTNEVATGLQEAPDNQSGDNGNTLNMVALRNQALVNGTDTLNNYYAVIAAKVGLTASQNSQTLETAGDTLDQISSMRDAISGVSVEEEMLLLVQYQAGFEAAARFLTAVDEMLDTLMAM